MATTPLPSPETATGVELSASEPLPSWPAKLVPQHVTPPAPVSGQVWPPPAVTALTPLPRPTTATGTELSAVFPSPSCPDSFPPQPLTAPPVVSAHV